MKKLVTLACLLSLLLPTIPTGSAKVSGEAMTADQQQARLQSYSNLLGLWKEYRAGTLPTNWNVESIVSVGAGGALSGLTMTKTVAHTGITNYINGLTGLLTKAPKYMKSMYDNGNLRSTKFGLGMTDTNMTYTITLSSTDATSASKLLTMMNSTLFVVKVAKKNEMLTYLSSKWNVTANGNDVVLQANVPITEASGYFDRAYAQAYGVNP